MISKLELKVESNKNWNS